MAKQVEGEVLSREEKQERRWARRNGRRGNRTIIRQGGGNTVYSMGMIGAAVYYISTATGFWMGVLGLLKALVWPAFLVYHAMKSLGM